MVSGTNSGATTVSRTWTASSAPSTEDGLPIAVKVSPLSFVSLSLSFLASFFLLTMELINRAGSPKTHFTPRPIARNPERRPFKAIRGSMSVVMIEAIIKSAPRSTAEPIRPP